MVLLRDGSVDDLRAAQEPMKQAIFSTLLLLLAQPLFGATITISPSKDNTLYESSTGALSNGAGQYFFAGMTGPNANNDLRRGLLAFDIASVVPAGSTIQSVSLRLNMSNANIFVPTAAFALHRVLSDWGQGSSNAGPPGGDGAASTAGDATWRHRFFNGTLWATPGGDFFSTPSLSTTVGLTGVYNFSSPQMAADVQSWLNTPASSFGWMVRGGESVPISARRYDTRENTTVANRPLLTVTFEPVPEPTTALLVCGGLAALCAQRRRG